VFAFSHESVRTKLTTNVAVEDIPESKVATPVKQQIKWCNMVQLTTIYLLRIHTSNIIVPKAGLMTFI
jgi:hypothetical protein